MNIIQLLKTKLGYFNSNQMGETEIFYVAGSQSLPPPLEAKEEEKLINKLETEEDFEARQIFIDEFFGHFFIGNFCIFLSKQFNIFLLLILRHYGQRNVTSIIYILSLLNF